MADWQLRRIAASVLVLALALAAGAAGGSWLSQPRSHRPDDAVAATSQRTWQRSSPHDPASLLATYAERDKAGNSAVEPPRVATGERDLLGRLVTVSCASCHSNFEPGWDVSAGEQLSDFHQGLHFDHGHLTCLTCHHSENYNLLQLADGRPLEFSDTNRLCAQCHAPQARDYAQGVHGGMTGYWDLTRGKQVRKNCTDCHDPHSPAMPSMVPTFKPYDRFLEGQGVHGEDKTSGGNPGS